MARPKKQTVDFFPHYARHSKTIFVLQQRFGIAGYAFWFKLLEQLASHEGHYLDLNDENELEYLGAETMVSGAETLSMLTLLAKLGAIDPILWQKRLVWCQKFVDNLTEVYAKRTVSVPQKPVSVPDNSVSDTDNPQSRVDESKLINGVKTPIDKTMYKEQTIELDEQGEIIKTKPLLETFGRSPATIAAHYCRLMGKTSAGRQLPAAKELCQLAQKEYPEETLKEWTDQIIARIDVAFKYYEKVKKVKDWNLSKVAENWDKILQEWFPETKKYQ